MLASLQGPDLMFFSNGYCYLMCWKNFLMGETNQYMPHPRQSPKETKVQFYWSSPWEPMRLLGFLTEHGWGAAARGAGVLKQPHWNIFTQQQEMTPPVATDGVPLLIVSPAYLLYPHPRPQRPQRAERAAGYSGERPMTPRGSANSQQARLWGAHTASLMMVTLLCWRLGRIAPSSSTLSISIMRASWTENRTQGEKKGWEIFLNQLQRAGWKEFHKN